MVPGTGPDYFHRASRPTEGAPVTLAQCNYVMVLSLVMETTEPGCNSSFPTKMLAATRSQMLEIHDFAFDNLNLTYTNLDGLSGTEAEAESLTWRLPAKLACQPAVSARHLCAGNKQSMAQLAAGDMQMCATSTAWALSRYAQLCAHAHPSC